MPDDISPPSSSEIWILLYEFLLYLKHTSIMEPLFFRTDSDALQLIFPKIPAVVGHREKLNVLSQFSIDNSNRVTESQAGVNESLNEVGKVVIVT